MVVDWDPAAARRRGEFWRAERFEAGQWPTSAIVRRQFGNLSKALFVAGVRPRSGPTRGRSHTIADEEIVGAIRRWTELYGEPPAMADWSPARARRAGQEWRLERYYAGDWPSVNTVLRRFGTFGEAVRRAGLEPRPRGRHTSSRAAIASDARSVIQMQLDAGGLRCGPGLLATRVRIVAAAQTAGDPTLLRGALIDLAAAALSWADLVSEISLTPVAA
jgi:Homing endonuclease associated repeat